jgi:alpha-galactosidase
VSKPSRITFGPAEIGLHIRIREDGAVFVGDPGVPLIALQADGEGTDWSGPRTIETSIGARLRYVWHEQSDTELSIVVYDSVTGLEVTARYSLVAGVLRARVSTVNKSDQPVRLRRVNVATIVGISRIGALRVGDQQWLAENQWRDLDLASALPDLTRSVHEHDPRGAFTLASKGSWSTDRHLPMGAIVSADKTWLWQIESNSGWSWEIGELDGDVYLSTSGPDELEQHWTRLLSPGQGFTTVPVAIVASARGFEDAVAQLTSYRRAIRRPHRDGQELPVIFNDYMNTIRADPTTDKLWTLIDAAAEVGAEYFCIDAGWYDEERQGWWDSVGEWEPSMSRFPDGGLGKVIQHIKDCGMIPGLWLEPEVIGIRSEFARKLPDEAFLRRHEIRAIEHKRYHLDFRHPAACGHLDAVVDRLVTEFGIGYFKLDYNINIGAAEGVSEHGLAFIDWLNGVLDRYPNLVIENCASGGMRQDYAQLAVAQVQSTSDQQDPLKFPPIAVNVPVAIAPEQAANWVYPQPEHSDNEIAFILALGMLSRVHLSGFLNKMTADQRALVKESLTTYKQLRPHLATATPFWPLGLATWTAEWTALGMNTTSDGQYLALWRRPGTQPEITIPTTATTAEILFPETNEAHLTLTNAQLTLTLPETTAIILKLH